MLSMKIASRRAVFSRNIQQQLLLSTTAPAATNNAASSSNAAGLVKTPEQEAALKAKVEAELAKKKEQDKLILEHFVTENDMDPFSVQPYERDEHFPYIKDPKIPKGANAIVEKRPAEYASQRHCYIYRPNEHVMNHTTVDKVKGWKIFFDPKPESKWSNNLMGWIGTNDSLGRHSANWLSFTSKETAIRYVEKMGHPFTVLEYVPEDLYIGKKSYADNFLNRHVQNRIKGNPVRVAKEQFAHPERGQSAWVNLAHTPFGAKKSEMVSQTQFDPSFPKNTQSAKSWQNVTYERRAEYSRKLGK